MNLEIRSDRCYQNRSDYKSFWQTAIFSLCKRNCLANPNNWANSFCHAIIIVATNAATTKMPSLHSILYCLRRYEWLQFSSCLYTHTHSSLIDTQSIVCCISSENFLRFDPSNQQRVTGMRDEQSFRGFLTKIHVDTRRWCGMSCSASLKSLHVCCWRMRDSGRLPTHKSMLAWQHYILIRRWFCNERRTRTTTRICFHIQIRVSFATRNIRTLGHLTNNIEHNHFDPSPTQWKSTRMDPSILTYLKREKRKRN